MPAQQRRRSQAPEATTSAPSSSTSGSSNADAQAELIGDGSMADTFTYVCTGQETYGTLAQSAGGDYRLAMQLNPTVRPEGLAAGVQLQLPRAWAHKVGAQDPFFELFGHLGGKEEPDPKRVTDLWEHLTADERSLILNNPQTAADAKRALGLPATEASKTEPTVFQQLVEGSIALATTTAQAMDSGQSWLEGAVQSTSNWWSGTNEEEELARMQAQAAAARATSIAMAEASKTPQMKRIEARKKQMMAVFDQYTQMTITVPINGVPTEMQVRAKYRISLDQGGGENPWQVTQIHKARGQDWATAKSGKASPEALATALQSLADTELASQLRAVKTEAEAREIIEKAAQRQLGVDCSGFVFRMLQGIDESALFVNQACLAKENKHKATSDPKSLHAYYAANGGQMVAGGLPLTGKSDEWETGDIIRKPGSGGSGHIAMIYDVQEDDGRQRVQFMESAGTDGVRLSTVWFDASSGQWQTKSGTPAKWPNSGCSVTRPAPFAQALPDAE